MADPLVAATDLAEFPGAPFPVAIVASAAESVRRDAGWHIAPSVTETVTVDGKGGQWLFLPSLHVTAVTAVRDVSGDTPTTLTGWRLTRAGMLYRAAGWPYAVAAVEVDLTHGYDACPPELLPAIAARAQSARVNHGTGNVRLGSLSVSPPDAPSVSADEAVARFTIPHVA